VYDTVTSHRGDEYDASWDAQASVIRPAVLGAVINQAA
jgi:hypothetical protein